MERYSSCMVPEEGCLSFGRTGPGGTRVPSQERTTVPASVNRRTSSCPGPACLYLPTPRMYLVLTDGVWETKPGPAHAFDLAVKL